MATGHKPSTQTHHHWTEYVIRLYVLTMKMTLDADWA